MVEGRDRVWGKEQNTADPRDREIIRVERQAQPTGSQEEPAQLFKVS